MNFKEANMAKERIFQAIHINNLLACDLTFRNGRCDKLQVIIADNPEEEFKQVLEIPTAKMLMHDLLHRSLNKFQYKKLTVQACGDGYRFSIEHNNEAVNYSASAKEAGEMAITVLDSIRNIQLADLIIVRLMNELKNEP
jgi:hypothetical protein